MSKPIRTVVVEDEHILALALEDMMAHLGYTHAGTATGRDDARKLIEASDFDVAVLDVRLQGTADFTLATAVAAKGKAVVFASGYLEQVAVPEHLGHWPVVEKPYNEAGVAEAIAKALAIGAAQQKD